MPDETFLSGIFLQNTGGEKMGQDDEKLARLQGIMLEDLSNMPENSHDLVEPEGLGVAAQMPCEGSRKEALWYAWFGFLITLALFFVVPILLLIFDSKIHFLTDESSRLITHVGMGLTIFIPMGMWIRKHSATTIFGKKMSFMAIVPTVIAAIAAVFFVSSIVSMATLIFRAVGWGPVDKPEPMFLAPLWLQLLLIAVIVPIYEEFFFRGALMSSLQKATASRWWGIILSSVLFGLMHGKVESALALIVAGILLGVMASYTNSLTISVIMHSTYNGTVVLTSALMSSSNASSIQAINDILNASQVTWAIAVIEFLLSGILLAACMAAVIWLGKKKVIRVKEYQSWQPPKPLAYLPLILPFLLVILYSIFKNIVQK